MSVQLAFGSVEVTGPRPDDLEGLLCGPGELVRHAQGVRISVVVHEQWRADALLQAFAERELAGDTEPAEAGGTSVRTPFTDTLTGLADAWTVGALTLPPQHLTLDGGALRVWLLAAGQPVPGRPDAWDLALTGTETGWPQIGAALAATGVPGALVGPRRRAGSDAPATGTPARAVYRVLGIRRLRRLRELVGPPPGGAPLLAWPSR